MDEKWVKHLLLLRRHKREQIEYLAKGNTRFHQTSDGVTTDVTGDWLDELQREYADISQLLVDNGVDVDA